VPGAGSRGNQTDDRVKVVDTPSPRQQTGFRQLIGDRKNIGGLTVGIEVEKSIEKDFVLGKVKIATLDDLNDVRDRIFT
jgi:hypothetical protein